jgi:hypothetical protein
VTAVEHRDFAYRDEDYEMTEVDWQNLIATLEDLDTLGKKKKCLRWVLVEE